MVRYEEEESLGYLLDEELKRFVNQNVLKKGKEEYEEMVRIAKEVILPLKEAVKRSRKYLRFLLIGG